MRILRTKLWAIALAVLIISTALGADDDPGLLAFIARSEQRCEELKQKKAEIERQAAQSQTIPPEQKTEVTKIIAELDKKIAETTRLLQDPTLQTNGGKKEIMARLQFAIAEGNILARSAEQQLGMPPSSAIDRVLDLNIERFKTWVSPGFDGVRKESNDDGNVVYRGGTRFFGIGGNSSVPVKAVAAYKPTTPQSAKAIVDHDGSVGGGIMLEDAAGGLGPVSSVKYDGRYNALVIDNNLVYFMKVPPWDAAALCRAIWRDNNTRVGVSRGENIFVFGERAAYENTDVAYDLMMTDHFLADVVFGWHKWTKGYKFPNGYVPQTVEVPSDMLVRFGFKNFQFRRNSGELGLASFAVEATMMPVSKEKAKDGGMLPDYKALRRGYAPPPEFLANAQYLTSHFNGFFSRERIVAKTLAYGELAALFRSFKQAGVNLEVLASELGS